jgi:hypothetical protein
LEYLPSGVARGYASVKLQLIKVPLSTSISS